MSVTRVKKVALSTMIGEHSKRIACIKSCIVILGLKFFSANSADVLNGLSCASSKPTKVIRRLKAGFIRKGCASSGEWAARGCTEGPGSEASTVLA